MTEEIYHEAVLVAQVIKYLHLKNPAISEKNPARIIDATLGTGGHALEILKLGAKVLGIEDDIEMLETAKLRLKVFKDQIAYFAGNFRSIDSIAYKFAFTEVDGIFFDLGVSNLHLTSPMRGFSFSYPNSDLDMRINKLTQKVTAADLVNVLRKDQLERVFEGFLSYAETKDLIYEIEQSRKLKAVKNVGEFLLICERVFRKKSSLNPATRAFLALRVAVNSELENLREALPKAFKLLKKGGRLVVISFHSLEDKIVKDFFKDKSLLNEGQILTTKPVLAESVEVNKNKRSRSAKLRAIEKNV